MTVCHQEGDEQIGRRLDQRGFAPFCPPAPAIPFTATRYPLADACRGTVPDELEVLGATEDGSSWAAPTRFPIEGCSSTRTICDGRQTVLAKETSLGAPAPAAVAREGGRPK